MTATMGGLVFLESVLKMPLMALPVRSVYVPMKNGAVFISPGSKLQEPQLKSLGPVSDLVAPNLFHCAGMAKAAQVFPQSKVWGPPGAAEHKPQIKWTAEISESAWPYQTELTVIPLRGISKINELVFVHHQSKSLIVADLCFHLIEARGFGPWLILNLFGTYQKLGVSKFFLKFMNDQAAFEHSLGQVFSHDFENIIVSHGTIVRGNGKMLLKQALAERGLKPSLKSMFRSSD